MMSDAPHYPNPQSQIPQITALSTAFPLDFESARPEPRQAPASPSATPNQPSRPTRRHDAGE